MPKFAIGDVIRLQPSGKVAKIVAIGPSPIPAMAGMICYIVVHHPDDLSRDEFYAHLPPQVRQQYSNPGKGPVYGAFPVLQIDNAMWFEKIDKI